MQGGVCAKCMRRRALAAAPAGDGAPVGGVGGGVGERARAEERQQPARRLALLGRRRVVVVRRGRRRHQVMVVAVAVAAVAVKTLVRRRVVAVLLLGAPAAGVAGGRLLLALRRRPVGREAQELAPVGILSRAELLEQRADGLALLGGLEEEDLGLGAVVELDAHAGRLKVGRRALDRVQPDLVPPVEQRVRREHERRRRREAHAAVDVGAHGEQCRCDRGAVGELAPARRDHPAAGERARSWSARSSRHYGDAGEVVIDVQASRSL